ncbi:hypothetical protein AVEN_147577-1, partial [Araneus ventricosus]
GCGGLVERSRHQDRKVPGWKPSSTEDLPCIGPIGRQLTTHSRWYGAKIPILARPTQEGTSNSSDAEASRGGCQPRCRPRHLTAAQNYEVRPKATLVLFRNETLI